MRSSTTMQTAIGLWLGGILLLGACTARNPVSDQARNRERTLAHLPTREISDSRFILEDESTDPGSKDLGTPSNPGNRVEARQRYRFAGSFADACAATAEHVERTVTWVSTPLDCATPRHYTSGQAGIACRGFTVTVQVYVTDTTDQDGSTQVLVQLFAPYPADDGTTGTEVPPETGCSSAERLRPGQ